MGSPLSKKKKSDTEQMYARGLSFPDQPLASGILETQVMMTSLQCSRHTETLSQQVFRAQQYGILQEIQTENQISELKATKADTEEVMQCMEVALSACWEVQDLKQQFSELVEAVNRQTEVHNVENDQSQDHQANDCHSQDHQANDCHSQDHQANDCQSQDHQANDCQSQERQVNDCQSHSEGDRAHDQPAQEHQFEDRPVEDQQAERPIDLHEVILTEILWQRSVDTETLQTLSKQIDGVKVQIDTINISKRATKLDINILEGKCDNIQKLITEKADASDVAELKQTVEELKMAMNVLKEQDDNRTKEIRCLTTLTADGQANVSRISAGILQQQENISQLTSTQAETDRLIRNLGKVVAKEGEEIKSRVQRLEESQDKASNNIASLAAIIHLFVSAVDNRGREGIRNYNNTLWCQNQNSLDVSMSD